MRVIQGKRGQFLTIPDQTQEGDIVEKERVMSVNSQRSDLFYIP